MSKYAAEHASALADIRDDGAAVRFVLDVPGAHDATTGRLAAPTTVTVDGYALQVKSLTRGDHRVYESLSLTPTEAPLLLFAAATYGDVPTLGAWCLWNGVRHIVRGFGDPVAPGGVPILSRVVVAR